jgi:REP element-mobilizing transposase RayT
MSLDRFAASSPIHGGRFVTSLSRLSIQPVRDISGSNQTGPRHRAWVFDRFQYNIALIKMPRAKQLELPFSTWGGRRRGAGRSAGVRPRVRHRTRPEHRAAHPIHVTMRSAFRPLRNAFVFPTVASAIAEASRKEEERFRVVHFSVQVDHLHLVVEACDTGALSSGMRGLAIRLARRVNRLVGRTGRVWADRWHGRALTSPRTVRFALAYVLGNFRKHHPQASAAVDAFSSAPYFRGFRELNGRAPVDVKPSLMGRALAPPRRRAAGVPQGQATVRPRTWLLRVGWRRRGALSLFEAPSLRSS